MSMKQMLREMGPGNCFLLLVFVVFLTSLFGLSVLMILRMTR